MHLLVDVLAVGPDDAVLQARLQGLVGLYPLGEHEVIRALGQEHVHLVVCIGDEMCVHIYGY